RTRVLLIAGRAPQSTEPPVRFGMIIGVVGGLRSYHDRVVGGAVCGHLDPARETVIGELVAGPIVIENGFVAVREERAVEILLVCGGGSGRAEETRRAIAGRTLRHPPIHVLLFEDDIAGRNGFALYEQALGLGCPVL